MKSYYERVQASPAIKRESGWNVHSGNMKELLGLKSTAKLPVQGMPARVIQGVKVWVTPAAEPVFVSKSYGSRTGLLKRSTHRVMAECPRCGEHLSAGRLHQHICKAK